MSTPDTDTPETVVAHSGRRVEAGSIASVVAVRSGERVEVVAHLHPVTLADCETYAEARAVQERVQAWLASGRD